MDISTMPADQYVDIFSDGKTPQTQQMGQPPVRFGSDQDLFSVSVTDSTTKAPESSSTTYTTTAAPVVPTDTDILGTGKSTTDTTTKAPDILSLGDYFQDRLKSGRFVAINDTNDKGETVNFVPKTPEEFDEVIDIQVNYQLDQRKKEIENNWYQSKSPAWQAVARYAEMVDDPSEVLPFIQGVKSVDSITNLDPADVASAEHIVRVRLEQKGDTPDLIDEQIEALKTTDRLVSTAQKYKPIIVQEEKNQLAAMVRERKAQEEEWMRYMEDISSNAMKAVDSPLFGKYKLKQDEKALVYQMIGVPSPETQGYPIYMVIDDLFRKKDMETLKQLALFLTNRDSFMNYASQSAADKTATELQRRLRVANDVRSSGGTTDDSSSQDDNRPTIQRTRYTPKFGRQ